jgi:DNA-binding IclR family transcriptional regulator
MAENSVVRATRVLRRLSEAEAPLGLSALSADLGIPKSTAHKILASLVEEGFVEATSVGYVVGLAAFEVGVSYLRLVDSSDVVRPELARLAQDLGVTAHWAVVNGSDAVYLGKEDAPGLHIRLASSLGARLPAYTTAVGKSCLAWLPPEQQTQHLPDNLSSGDRSLLDEELRVTKERGYSTDAGLSARGVICVAAPVRSIEGVRGAIGVSYLQGHELSLSVVAEAVMAAAARASAALGGKVAS